MATLDSNKVTGVSVVSNASDAANKTYVDNYISGLGSPTIPSLINSAGGLLSVTSNTPGVYWYARTVGSPYNINAVASGNGYYVAGDSAGIALYSTDTISWTRSISSGFGSSAINSLIYYNGYFISGGSNVVQNWNSLNQFASNFPSTADVRCATYGSSGFVIGGEGESVVWTLRTTPFAANAIYTSMYDGTNYWIAGAAGFLATSTDSIIWILRTSSATIQLGYATGGNGLLYASGQTNPYVYAGASGVLASSTDGIIWTQRTSASAAIANQSLSFGALPTATYVRANATAGNIATSTDSIAWTLRTTGNITNIIQSLLYSEATSEYYLNCRAAGALQSSTDAIVWINRTSGTAAALYQLLYADIYMVAGASGVLNTSTNSIVWTLRTSGTTSNLYGLAYTSGTYIASGAAGTNLYSTDAITWRLRTSGFGANVIQTSTFGNGIFINGGVGATLTTTTASTLATSGFGSRIANSPDGISWILRTTPSNMENTLLLASRGSDYVASCVDYENYFAGIIQSTDSVNWVLRTSGFSVRTANALMYYNGYYLLGGDSGGGNIVQWTLRTTPFTTNAIYTSLFKDFDVTSVGISSTFVSSGLVVHLDSRNPSSYPGSGNTWYDLSGNSNDMTLFGTTYYADGIYFTGSPSQGVINKNIINTGSSVPHTIDLWVNFTSTETSPNRWWLAVLGQYSPQSSLLIGDSAIRTQFGRWNYGNDPKSDLNPTLNGIDVWMNIVLTFNGSEYTCYINGVKDSSILLSTTVVFSNTNFALAKGPGGNEINFKGKVSVVKIYNRALTDSEVSQNYSSYSPVTTSPTYFISGAAGFLATSTDSIVWTLRTSGTTAQIGYATGGSGIIYAPGQVNSYVYAGASGVLATSTDSIVWTLRTSASAAVAIQSVVYGIVTYLRANATAGNIAASTDGITWTLRTTGNTTNIINGLLCAYKPINSFSGISDEHLNCRAGGAIQTSSDTIVWTNRTSGTTLALHQLLYGNVYVVCGASGVLNTSTNAIQWTLRTSGTTQALYGLAYTSGTYIASGAAGTTLYSTDSIVWITRTSGFGTNAVQTVNFGSGIFVNGGVGATLSTTTPTTLANSIGSGSTLVSSTDSISWSLRTTGANNNITALASGNNQYIASSINGLLNNTIIVSTDTINWSESASLGTTRINSLVYGNIYMASGNTGVLYTSTNTLVWTLRTTGETTNLTTLSYTPQGTYLLGTSGGIVRSSTDGITWISRTSGTTNAINQFANSSSTYIAAASSGTLLYGNSNTLSYLGNGGLVSVSTNGIQWSLRTTCADIQSATDLVAGNNYYLAYGTNYLAQSVLIASTDTINWVIRTTPFVAIGINDLENPTSNNYLAVGNSGLLATSTDSFIWILRTSSFGANAINAVTHNQLNLFVAAGVSGILNSSSDGINWILRTSGFGTSSINTLTYDSNSNYYIAASAGGTIRTSTDAITWSSRSSPTTNQLNSISNFNDYYLIGGNTSTLLASSTDTTQLKWFLPSVVEVSTTESSGVITDGLVIYLNASDVNSYPGSGTTWYDLSGYNNHATLIGGTSYSTLGGGSIYFDGIDGHVSITGNASNTPNLMTLMCLVYPKNTRPEESIATQNFGTGWRFQSRVWQYGNGTLWGFIPNQDLFGYEYTGTTQLVNNSRFYCLSITYMSSQLKGYLDGNLEMSIQNPGSLVHGGNIYLGAGYGGAQGWLKGNISKFLMYNRVLSSSEIVYNYNILFNL